MELPDSITTISIVLALGISFFVGTQLSKMLGLTTYLTVLLQMVLVIILYVLIQPLLLILYNTVTGTTNSNTFPSVSKTPNILLFSKNPQKIPTNTKPIIPSAGTTSTHRFGTNCLITINTTTSFIPPKPASLDCAPIVTFHKALPNSSTPGEPVLTIGYMPEGDLLQAIFYGPEFPKGVETDSRVSIGTPPIKKGFSLFLRTIQSSPGYSTVEIYINGVLGKTATVPSEFFGASKLGGVIPVIGYKAGPDNYPEIDAEIQSLAIWGDASSLTTQDIQSLSTQQIGSDHSSLQKDTGKCPSE
jgi:hypothetical protein